MKIDIVLTKIDKRTLRCVVISAQNSLFLQSVFCLWQTLVFDPFGSSLGVSAVVLTALEHLV